jgi:hypothetical protein
LTRPQIIPKIAARVNGLPVSNMKNPVAPACHRFKNGGKNHNPLLPSKVVSGKAIESNEDTTERICNFNS